MRLALHILGTEVFAITTDRRDDHADDAPPGDCTTIAAGFVPSATLPIREPGRDHEEW